MNDPQRLQRAIRDLHGLDSAHVESVRVHETFQGKTTWQGTVEVFQVQGHPQALLAYAWTYKDDNGILQHVAVLGVPPIDSAQKAVQAAVVAEGRKRGMKGNAWPGAMIIIMVTVLFCFFVLRGLQRHGAGNQQPTPRDTLSAP